MHERTRKPERPRDLDELAAAIVQDATAEDEAAPPARQQGPAAVELGQEGPMTDPEVAAANAAKQTRAKEIADGVLDNPDLMAQIRESMADPHPGVPLKELLSRTQG
jgi:hypothetical protein